jgi:hypothetical protein
MPVTAIHKAPVVTALPIARVSKVCTEDAAISKSPMLFAVGLAL